MSDKIELKMHEDNYLNRPEIMDDIYAVGGLFEKGFGRERTKAFTLYFLKHEKIPYESDFSLLDVGCALGDAAQVIKKSYPNVNYNGVDISKIAIDRANEKYGDIANFSVKSIENVDRKYDVIFCSNVLEHIENNKDFVKLFVDMANIVYILVPYNETYFGEKLKPEMRLDTGHVSTIDENTYKEFESDEIEFSYKTFRVPYYWGDPLWKLIIRKAYAFFFRNKRQYELSKTKQLLITLKNKEVDFI